MDIDLLREVVTVLSFVSFLGIIGWAVHPANRERFQKAAMSPLEEDE